MMLDGRGERGAAEYTFLSASIFTMKEISQGHSKFKVRSVHDS